MKGNPYIGSLIVLILLLSANTFAQRVQFNVQTMSSYSLIPTINHKPNPVPANSGFWVWSPNDTYSEKFESQIGGNFKANVDFVITKRIYLSSGLGLTLNRFQRKIELENINEQYVVASNDNVGKTSLIFLDVPVVVGYKLFNDKLKFQLGAVSSIMMSSKEFMPSTNGVEYRFEYDKSGDSFNKFLISGTVSISYLVWKNIALTACYNRQFNNIYDSGSEAKNQNIGLGVEFRFSPKPILAVQ